MHYEENDVTRKEFYRIRASETRLCLGAVFKSKRFKKL